MTVANDVIGIDPGTEVTAWVRLDPSCRRVRSHGIEGNDTVLHRLHEWSQEVRPPRVAIEMIESFGMPVGREVFETVWWIGRYCEAGGEVVRVRRSEIKLHLCNTKRGANDSTIRQALIDRFGPGKPRAVGLKKSPGPLYGIRKDEWQALAVAVTFFDLSAARSSY